jgi:hypothetical protein
MDPMGYICISWFTIVERQHIIMLHDIWHCLCVVITCIYYIYLDICVMGYRMSHGKVTQGLVLITEFSRHNHPINDEHMTVDHTIKLICFYPIIYTHISYIIYHIYITCIWQTEMGIWQTTTHEVLPVNVGWYPTFTSADGPLPVDVSLRPSGFLWKLEGKPWNPSKFIIFDGKNMVKLKKYEKVYHHFP